MSTKENLKNELKVPNTFFYGTGKRKSSIAKVWLFQGNGQIEVNKLSAIDYFGHEKMVTSILDPLKKIGIDDKYNVFIKVLGGGKAGQSDAVVLGLSRAIIEMNNEFRSSLKKEGFLKRDPRVKERKKYGRKKARKGFQFRKR